LNQQIACHNFNFIVAGISQVDQLIEGIRNRNRGLAADMKAKTIIPAIPVIA
jgi:hypothetical protein